MQNKEMWICSECQEEHWICDVCLEEFCECEPKKDPPSINLDFSWRTHLVEFIKVNVDRGWQVGRNDEEQLELRFPQGDDMWCFDANKKAFGCAFYNSATKDDPATGCEIKPNLGEE